MKLNEDQRLNRERIVLDFEDTEDSLLSAIESAKNGRAEKLAEDIKDTLSDVRRLLARARRLKR